MNNLATLVFAPSFLIALSFFPLAETAFFAAMLVFLWIIIQVYKEGLTRSLAVPLIYFLFTLGAALMDSLNLIKNIPLLISILFFLMFVGAVIGKKRMVLGFVKRFYPKELSHAEVRYLSASDLYWAMVTGANSMVQWVVITYFSLQVWAFYSSVGWYILFAVAGIAHYLYGRFYALRLLA
ncbi:MAG: hypothetical protein U9Q62_12030 [Campylobacterota bacterium]|nr:hypothetical protein [Campylobacterota bacterium]